MSRIARPVTVGTLKVSSNGNRAIQADECLRHRTTTLGHTWHHPDDVLFGITKGGVAPPYGPPGYQSDMPAFGAILTDTQIWDVLAYIKSRWSPRALEAQAQITKQRGEK